MKRHLVLVVEDDLEIREAFVEILEENGCEVISAANGQRALEYLRTTPRLPCLILLDLMMPVMDGQAFREAQLEDPDLAHIPIVVVSAHRDVAATAERLRAVDVLGKPPRIDELVHVVEQHC